MNIEVIELWPPIEKCAICSSETPLGFSLPMHEGKVVDTIITDEWAGMLVCRNCHDTYYRDVRMMK